MKGLFLDPRTWQIDFQSSSLWSPEKFGLRIDLHPDAFHIPRQGVKPDYEFVIASEVWEIPIRKTLQYLRDKGLKVFLMPREPLKTDILKEAMFSQEKFFFNNEYYFTPDVVLAPSPAYAELWKDKTKTVITGYPRWDYYVDRKNWASREAIAKKFGLDPNKKTIFFPSYPPYCYMKENGVDIKIDLFPEREETIRALEEFARHNRDYQVVIKIHPMSFKCYRKKIGSGKEVSGLLESHYKKPKSYLKVIGDIRNSGRESKELLIFSDIVVGFASTMMLEAAVLKKPSIFVLFGKSQELQGLPEFKNEMPTAYDANDLHKLLSGNLALGSMDWLIEKYFYKVDDQACKRICEAIKNEL